MIGEVYNIGTQKERTVKDVARQIAKIFGLSEVHGAHADSPTRPCPRRCLLSSEDIATEPANIEASPLICSGVPLECL